MPPYDVLFRKEGFYERLIEKHPHLEKYTYGDIKTIVRSYNRSICEKCVEDPNGVALPLRTGVVAVVIWNRSITYNKKLSIATGEKIRYNNQHSDGYGGGVYYSAWDVANERPHFSGGCYWYFKPCREFNRSIAKVFFSGEWRKYSKVTKTRKLKEMLAGNKALSAVRRMEHFLKQTYDEFDFS